MSSTAGPFWLDARLFTQFILQNLKILAIEFEFISANPRDLEM